MSIKKKFLKLINAVEDLFMTNHSCLCCGKEIADGTKFSLCTKCFSEINFIDGTLCTKCGDVVLENNNICDYCKNANFNFDQNKSLTFYDDVTGKIIKNFKYSHRRYYAESVAEMLAENKSYFEDVDIITFVPINKARKRERGFNQAEEIAKHLAEILDKPLAKLLTKSDNAKHQAGLTKSERLKNIIGSFEVNKNEKDKITNKVILIVDDVFTTGATLNECSKVLKKAKPSKVKTLTFAKTKL